LNAPPPAFDVLGELPVGTTVLEAAAGTGKTFTIAGLATRYVAEGRTVLPELMLVTFGREATHELRERVRARLVDAERALRSPVTARADGDALHRMLAAVPDAQVEQRRRRLAHALAQFDAATIATTHQFCREVLAGLGTAADADRDAVFVDRVDDLVAEVVDDFYVRKYGRPGAEPPAFGRRAALELARRAVADPQARLEPAGATPGSTAQVRHSFTVAVRAEVERRKRVRRWFTYDDMLTRLRDTLDDPVAGPAACARLRARYQVVLVDEFQDTDPVQWRILERAFYGHTTLVLIGDPKQAVYAFRGADVDSYLRAAASAGAHATLAVNHRSDAPLLDALHAIFGGVALGDERIVVRPVDAAHAGRRLVDASSGAPLRLRVLRHDQVPIPAGKQLAPVPPVRAIVARDLAADVATLLSGPARLLVTTAAATSTPDPTSQASPTPRRRPDACEASTNPARTDPDEVGRPVRPGDVAVLVRTNAQGVLVRDTLAGTGVPAVLAGTASVFGGDVAAQWLTLLVAVEQPARTTRVRAVALTCFLGRDVAALCGPDADAVIDELSTVVRSWSVLLREQGVAALLEAVTVGTGLPRRLLAQVDGERRLTDVRHVGEALLAASLGASGGDRRTAARLGPAELVEWLRRRIAEAGTDTGVERSRRLESDAEAVQIITVHRSKGLEFPVVYVPFAWDRWTTDPEVALLHEGEERVLDVGGPTGEGWRDRCSRHRAEEAGEDLRLLYVAMTRARCQVVTWWAPTTTTAASPLHRLLVGRPAPGTPVQPAYRVPPPGAALATLRGLASDELAVEEADVGRAAERWRPPAADPVPLRMAEFGRRLDTAWRRTSYSALTAPAHALVRHDGGSEPEEPGTADEPLDAVPTADGAGPPAAGTAGHLPSPMAALPVGAGFGTLVHAVLEVADPTAPDLLAELTTRSAEQIQRHPAPGVGAATLAAALATVVETPLGSLADGRRLRDIAPADRLAELTFEFPLAGGDHARGTRGDGVLTLGRLVPLLRRHLGPTDPLHGYAEALATPALAGQPLRGYLNGSIDAVLRLRAGTDEPRYVVVDYKTNWLGPPGAAEPLTAAHYVPPVLAAAMVAAHYPLQALIYSVALHRFLRWRQPGYDPAQHLGGVLYLFVRGMCGPATPTVDGTPCGVFGWAPPPGLVMELSDALSVGSAVGEGSESPPVSVSPTPLAGPDPTVAP